MGGFSRKKIDSKGNVKVVQCPKQEGRDNFYKGILQLQELIKFSENTNFKKEKFTPGKLVLIFPLLVVKSEIFVVRYNNGLEGEVFQVPWVWHRSNIERKFVNIEDGAKNSFFAPKAPIYFSIVHADNLKDFFHSLPAGAGCKSRIKRI